MLLLAGLAAEVTFRGVRLIRPSRVAMDPKLGWKINAYISRHPPGRRLDGTTYSNSFRSSAHGFRAWGDTATPKKRLLVVGDSFTEAYQVSNDQTYYARLHRMLGDD